MTVASFSPAVKPATHARIALTGPPGSGKLYTALRLASGFGGSIGVVDTKAGAALQYADRFDFSVLPMARFDPADLTRVCAVAADSGIRNLIIATMSAFWSGADGMLEQVDQINQSAGARDKGTGWSAMRDTERAMTAALLGYGGNVLATVNTRVEYVVGSDDTGGSRPVAPYGGKPDQRDGFAYDFGLVLAMHAGTATVTKARGVPLDGEVIHHPGEDLAEYITIGLAEGATGDLLDPREIRDWAFEEGRTVEELRDRHGALARAGQTGAVVTVEHSRLRELIATKTGVERVPGDREGDLIAIGDLLRSRAAEVRAAAATTAPQIRAVAA